MPPCEVPLVRPDQWQIEGLAVTVRRPPEAGPALLAGQHRPVGGHVFRSPRHLDHVARPQRRHLDPVDDRMGPAARGATHDVQGAGSTHQLVVHACRRDVVGKCPPGALVRIEAEQLVQVARVQGPAGRGHAEADAPDGAASRRNGRRRQCSGSRIQPVGFEPRPRGRHPPGHPDRVAVEGRGEGVQAQGNALDHGPGHRVRVEVRDEHVVTPILQWYGGRAEDCAEIFGVH